MEVQQDAERERFRLFIVPETSTDIHTQPQRLSPFLSPFFAVVVGSGLCLGSVCNEGQHLALNLNVQELEIWHVQIWLSVKPWRPARSTRSPTIPAPTASRSGTPCGSAVNTPSRRSTTSGSRIAGSPSGTARRSREEYGEGAPCGVEHVGEGRRRLRGGQRGQRNEQKDRQGPDEHSPHQTIPGSFMLSCICPSGPAEIWRSTGRATRAAPRAAASSPAPTIAYRPRSARRRACGRARRWPRPAGSAAAARCDAGSRPAASARGSSRCSY